MTSGPYSSSVCQVCYNFTRYVQIWGSVAWTSFALFDLPRKCLGTSGSAIFLETHMSYSLNSLKGVIFGIIRGTSLGVITGDA